jgi:hypothetical protein
VCSCVLAGVIVSSLCKCSLLSTMARYETLIILTSGGDISNHTVFGILLHFGESVLMIQVLPEKMFCDTNELFGHILSTCRTCCRC